MKIDIELLLEKLEHEEQRLYNNGEREAASAIQTIYFAIKESMKNES